MQAQACIPLRRKKVHYSRLTESMSKNMAHTRSHPYQLNKKRLTSDSSTRKSKQQRRQSCQNSRGPKAAPAMTMTLIVDLGEPNQTSIIRVPLDSTISQLEGQA